MKMGSITYQKGSYCEPERLRKYVEECIKCCLKHKHFWQQPKVIQEFKVTINVKPNKVRKRGHEVN